MKSKSWFEVDRKGLSGVVARRSKGSRLLELIQNAWDQRVTRVDFDLERDPKATQFVTVRAVDDDPDGFSDLSLAYTLFAQSEKRALPERRGRFCVGEKMVLAMCSEATITTTKGQVIFSAKGRRKSRLRRDRGTEFVGRILMTRDEMAEAMEVLGTVIPPEGIETRINGSIQTRPKLVTSFDASLPMEVGDAEGELRRVTRKCRVEVFEPRDGETPTLYEMGLPVIATGDKYHVSIGQKVPQNLDRDNVSPPSYMSLVRALVVGHTADLLTEQDASSEWVRVAAAHPKCSPEAVGRTLDLRFGPKRASYDPSDPEANRTLVSKGYTLVHGGSMTEGEWENAKRADAIRPAGQIAPTPKPFRPGGRPLEPMPRKLWTPFVERFVEFVKQIAEPALGKTVQVVVVNDSKWPHGAAFGPDFVLYLNVGRLGRDWFARDMEDKLALLIHEFGHREGQNHLDAEYHGHLGKIGARMTRLALTKPELFASLP